MITNLFEITPTVSIILYGIGEKIRLDMGCMPEMFFSELWHDPRLSCLPLF